VDLLVLGALAAGATHGYGVATRVRERTAGALEIEDAALYQALHRLERRGLITAEWGVSDNNRRARFYELTSAGRKRLRAEAANWRRYAEAVAAVLEDA
jgi:transcriptional regulator